MPLILDFTLLEIFLAVFRRPDGLVRDVVEEIAEIGALSILLFCNDKECTPRPYGRLCFDLKKRDGRRFMLGPSSIALI